MPFSARRPPREPSDLTKSSKTGPLDYCLKLLGRRLYTQKELEQKLQSKNFSPAQIRQVLKKLTSSGLIDDRAFAKSFIQTRMALNPKSPRLIYFELLKKGVDKDLAKEVLEKTELPSQEILIEQILRKKLPQLKNLPREVKLRRMVNYLARRGFNFSQIYPFLNKLD